MLTRRGFVGVLGTVPLAFGQSLKPAKGAIIRTVLKDLAPEELSDGATLFHEHLSLAPDFLPRWIQYSRPPGAAGPAQHKGVPSPQPGQKYFMEDLDLMSAELRAAKAEGVSCLVDGGHEDMGRNLSFLKRLSQQSGMPIVAGTGFYAQPFYQPELLNGSEEELTAELVRLARTQPVGAFGEIGSWDEITDTERKVFRAVGKAHVSTNLPIFTHTGIPGKSALEQLDILEKAGVKPNRIVIGHLGNLVDADVKVHKEICKRGAYVGLTARADRATRNRFPWL